MKQEVECGEIECEDLQFGKLSACRMKFSAGSGMRIVRVQGAAV